MKNPGASGSLFYLTSDDQFILKTVQKKEASFLKSLLPGYYMVRSYFEKVHVENSILESHSKSSNFTPEILWSLLLSGKPNDDVV